LFEGSAGAVTAEVVVAVAVVVVVVIVETAVGESSICLGGSAEGRRGSGTGTMANGRTEGAQREESCLPVMGLVGAVEGVWAASVLTKRVSMGGDSSSSSSGSGSSSSSSSSRSSSSRAAVGESSSTGFGCSVWEQW